MPRVTVTITLNVAQAQAQLAALQRQVAQAQQQMPQQQGQPVSVQMNLPRASVSGIKRAPMPNEGLNLGGMKAPTGLSRLAPFLSGARQGAAAIGLIKSLPEYSGFLQGIGQFQDIPGMTAFAREGINPTTNRINDIVAELANIKDWIGQVAAKLPGLGTIARELGIAPEDKMAREYEAVGLAGAEPDIAQLQRMSWARMMVDASFRRVEMQERANAAEAYGRTSGIVHSDAATETFRQWYDDIERMLNGGQKR